tara:strand:+ start:517 stop:741 length:225 start_codon:yes stop_codon:yes gene_type:complete
MFTIDKNLQTVLIIFLFINFVVYKLKPDMVFNKEGEMKDFGVGSEKTITPFWLVTLSLTLIIYIYINVKTDDFV